MAGCKRSLSEKAKLVKKEFGRWGQRFKEQDCVRFVGKQGL